MKSEREEVVARVIVARHRQIDRRGERGRFEREREREIVCVYVYVCFLVHTALQPDVRDRC